MKTVTIKRVSRKNKVSSKGRPYESVGIQVEGMDGWINGFGNKDNLHWEPGMEIEIEIEDTQYGKQFKQAKSSGDNNTLKAMFDSIRSLEERVNKLEGKDWNTGGDGWMNSN